MADAVRKSTIASCGGQNHVTWGIFTSTRWQFFGF